MSWSLTIRTANRSELTLPSLPTSPPFRLKGVFVAHIDTQHYVGTYPATAEVLFDLDELVQEATTYCLYKEQA